jgi:HEAT repeat protein
LSWAHVDDAARIFATLGTPDAIEAIRRATEAGADVAATLLAAWRTRWNVDPQADVRDVHHDALSLAAALARKHPCEVLAACERDRELAAMLVPALGTIDDPRADALLVYQLASPLWTQRAFAVRALASRPGFAPSIREAIRAALDDPESSVATAALEALTQHGALEDVRAISELARCCAGHLRERALDAVEAMCARLAAPLPEGHPSARLERVSLEGDAPFFFEARPVVVVGDRVDEGQELAALTGDVEGALPAPCHGVVVAIEREGERSLAIVIRRGFR